MKRSWVEIRTRRSLKNYCYRQNRLILGKINVIYCKLIVKVGHWEIKINWKKAFCHSILLGLNFTPSSSTCSPPSGTGGWEVEVVGQLITYHLCHSFFLGPLPYSVMGFLPWKAVLHELLQPGPFQQAAILQLLQSGSFLPDAVLQEWTAPVWVPHGPLFLWETFLLCGPLSAGCSFLQGISTCSSVAPPQLQVDVCFTVVFHELQGTAGITTVFTTGCRGISALAPVAPLPPPLPILTSAGLCLSHLISLSPWCCTASPTLSLKCYHRGRINTSGGLSFGQWQVYLRTLSDTELSPDLFWQR